jgi:hypothetical protein
VLAQVKNNGKLEPPESHKVVAALAMFELCNAVSTETGRDIGLAHQFADIDITAMTTPEPRSSASLFSVAQEAALRPSPTSWTDRWLTQSGIRPAVAPPVDGCQSARRRTK